MKRLSCLLLALLIVGCQAAPPEMTDARKRQHLESFDSIWTTVRDNHYDPKLGGVDWDAARARHRPAVEQATSDEQARSAMRDLLAELKLSHYAILAGDHVPQARHEPFVPPVAKDAPAREVDFGNLKGVPLRYHAQMLPSGVHYVYLSMFFDPASVMPKFRQAIQEARGAKGFILDLRHNPGGIGAMAMGIGNFFVDKPNLKLGTMHQRSMQLDFVLNPQADPYTKPLAILIDEGSGSTSEILAGGLQDLGRARVFGVRSAGQALPSMIVKLPNGDTFQYAVANYITTGGRTLEGTGVTPDEKVEYGAPYNEPDPVLQAAVRWIEKTSEKP